MPAIPITPAIAGGAGTGSLMALKSIPTIKPARRARSAAVIGLCFLGFGIAVNFELIGLH